MTLAFNEARVASSSTVQQHRYGLIKARIGSSHMIKIKGVRTQIMVSDKSQFGYADTMCRCLQCNRDWATEQEMRAEHDESSLHKEQERHVWFFWSNTDADNYAITARAAEVAMRNPGMPIDDAKLLVPSNVGALSDER